MALRVSRIEVARGSIEVPADKSLTHRAFMLGAIAQTKSLIHRPLMGEDCKRTLHCLEAMGLASSFAENSINLIPVQEWKSPNEPLFCGNSGTTARLLSGLIASRPMSAVLSGDASLSKRPMARITRPLIQMGAKIEGETCPLQISGGELAGIEYRSEHASAQVKSCILLAGLSATGETWVYESAESRDHTERMLTQLGVELLTDSEKGIGLRGGQVFDGFEMTIPGDISSAAFWMVLAAMIPGAEIQLKSVGVNPTRSGIFDVFTQGGIQIERENERMELGEPMCDLIVRGTAKRAPFKIQGELVPRLIDEIPVLALLATQCDGVSEIRDAQELVVKESNRLLVMAEGLRKMGADVELLEDGLIISGPTPLRAASIDSCHDHRIAMTFAIAGLIADGETEITGEDQIRTSYPEFESHMSKLCR